MTLDGAVAEALREAGLDPAGTERVVRQALAEDLAWGPDVTTAATTRPGTVADATVVSRQPGVLAGLPVALAVLDAAGLRPGRRSRCLPTGTASGPARRCCGSGARSASCSGPSAPC